MGLFPVVQSPCPYKGPISDILEGSTCTLCKREVHDLGAMAQADRIALLDGCKDEVCVRYAVPRASAIAAIALGAAAMASPAMAQEAQPAQQAPAEQSQQAQVAEVTAAAEDAWEDMVIVVGGMRDPRKARWHSDRPAAKGRALPVIVEPDAPQGEQRQPTAPVLSEGAKQT